MHATKFFQQYYQCPIGELSKLLSRALFYPPYLCAHPRPFYLKHIKECIFIEIVNSTNEPILCVCQPLFIDFSKNKKELIYLPLEDLEICPYNKENECKYLTKK